MTRSQEQTGLEETEYEPTFPPRLPSEPATSSLPKIPGYRLFIMFAGILLASVFPAGPAGHPAYARTADSHVEYAENRTVAVALFIAHDQDGDAIEWSLSGPDAALFTIDGGILRFSEPPNYDDPRSAARTNVYRVTIEANGAAHDVAVTVTDVDEAGAVTIDPPQPQVSRPLGASLSDEDDGVSAQTWQWARSVDGTIWTDIGGATSPRRSPVQEDEGMYLRATVTYSDKFGSGKTASAISAYRVEAKTLSNAAPSFAEQDDDETTFYVEIARSVAENTTVGKPIGRPVSALDADDDILFYELLDTPDLEDANGHPRFTIDNLTGQIRVGKELGADTGEPEDEDSRDLTAVLELAADDDPGEAGNGEYVLRVRATDPSTASATVNVIVTVTDVNEPPEFAEDAPTLLSVVENEDPLNITVRHGGPSINAGTYAVTDQDGIFTGSNPYDDATYTYSVTGADSDALTINGSGGLSFTADHEPDYEEQSSYSITIEARSGEGARRLSTTLDVTIDVVDAEDDGEVFLSQREPQVGREVHAWVSDPDGGVRVSTWTWERSDIAVNDDGTPSAECRDDPGTPGIGVDGDWELIDGASSSAYVPSLADVGKCLRATATYTDNIEGHGPADHDQDATEDGLHVLLISEKPVQASNPANTAPHFVVQSSRTSRRVFENTEADQDVGRPVSAHDEDGDLLIYTLGGADAASFGIAKNNGQLKTKAPLDYEARRSYTVQVTATDPSGASTPILVTISIINRDEPAQITGTSAVDFAENNTDPAAALSASDPERRSITWSLDGRDADRFTIGTGTLRFRKPPNFEGPHSALEGAALAERNVYRVTVQASGGAHDVVVRVTDVEEPGAVSMDRPQPQVDRPLSANLLDEDEGVVVESWQWARSEDGTTWTDIEGATSPRRSPVQEDEGMYLRATVAYSDRFGAGKIVSAVSANPVEAKTTSNAAPSFAGQDDDESTSYIDIARSVPENTAVGLPIGEPVSATDPDDDVLVYELLDTPDLEDANGDARFIIDSASGQIRVAKVLGADAEIADAGVAEEREDEDSTPLFGGPPLPAGEDAGQEKNSEYVLRVMATDPSTASVTVNVVVTVAEVNEAPAFREGAPTLLRVREITDLPENAGPTFLTLEDGETPIDADTFTVTDQDGEVTGPDGYDDTDYTYSLSGSDSRFFAFDSAGALGFSSHHEPDFETKSSYSITIAAHSGAGARSLTARLDVTIEVVNTEDLGKVLLSHRQPHVGIDLHATASDPDGGMIITRWLWERSHVIPLDVPSTKCEEIPDSDWTPIAGALSDVYTPKVDDLERCLRAKVFYADNLDVDQQAAGVLEVPVERLEVHGPGPIPSVNAAPVFPDQDFLTEGDQSDSTSRTVPENTPARQNIGAPVEAIDADGDLLTYTLRGADARYFQIDRYTGQLRTRSPLNFEDRNTYTVVVTATDGIGASDSIQVTINVTDEDDPAEITVNTVDADRRPRSDG